jgi:hypothetical protein
LIYSSKLTSFAAKIELSLGFLVAPDPARQLVFELWTTAELLLLLDPEEWLFEVVSTMRDWFVLLDYWIEEVAAEVDALVISLPNSLGLSTNLEVKEFSWLFLFSLLCMIWLGSDEYC